MCGIPAFRCYFVGFVACWLGYCGVDWALYVVCSEREEGECLFALPRSLFEFLVGGACCRRVLVNAWQ